MIEGHGDDAYRYGDIKSDFSSNICAHANHQTLMNHLMARPELISHYPEPEAWSLETIIAERYGLHSQQVIVTSGATEAIYLIAQTFHMQSEIPSPTFSEYEDACQLYLSSSDQTMLWLCNQLYLSSSDQTMLWLCNPNNPTGEVYAPSYIKQMVAEYDLVVLDQSYENYTDVQVMTPREGCLIPNVIQIHSMTKTYGVPGLRLGYITAHESLTAKIRQYLRPWSVSQHDELICKPDLQETKRLAKRLEELPDIEVTTTQTNFMLCRMASHITAELKDYLAREHHMLIRDASNFRSLTPYHFRIASQTPAENDALIEAFNQFMSRNG